MSHLHSFASALVLLLIVTDPLGNACVVIELLRATPQRRRNWVISRECALATLMLWAMMWLGPAWLHALQLSRESLEISGGLILLLIAMGMVFPGLGTPLHASDAHAEPLLVPLATPLVAGPSAMATVTLLVARQPDAMATWTAALFAAMAIGWVLLLSAQALARQLGLPVLRAIERLAGMLLSAMAVDMLTHGLKQVWA